MGNINRYPFITMPADDGKGPKKLGDPDDNSLSEVENKVLIPLLHHYIIINDKCKIEMRDLNECALRSGIFTKLNCSSVQKAANNCIDYWNNDDDYSNNMRKMYLDIRSEYRRTGVDSKLPTV